MSRPGISYNDVATAAQQLSDQAKNPTIEQIRLLLGTGSSTTIAYHLRRWKEARTSSSHETTNKHIPFELTSAIKGVWEQLAQHAEEKVFKLDEKHQQTLTEIQQELQKYKTNNQRWQQMYHQWANEKATLEHDKLNYQEEIISLKHDNTGLTAKIDAQHLQLTEKQQRIDELHRLHKLVQENLEHYRESMRTQRLIDQEKQEHELQQVKGSLKNTEQHLAKTNQDNEILQKQLNKLTNENAMLQKSSDDINSKFNQLQSSFTIMEKEQYKTKSDAAHWQQQHDILLNEQVKQSALLSQQVSIAHEEIKNLKDQNKLLVYEKLEITQEKAQLEGAMKQMQKMIYSNEVA